MKIVLALLVAPLASALAAGPVVVAHRGASGYLPEHTLAAKAYAHALGADFIEQDIVLSKDDVPLVLHDIYLDTISDVAARFPDRKRADGRYYALDFSLAELRQLEVSERFNARTGEPVYAKRYDSKATPGTFRISTLEEELQLIQGLNRSTGRLAGVYPEIKQPTWHREQGRDISKIVLPILARYGYAGKDALCFLQCFELTEIKRIRRELGWTGRIVMLLNGRGKEHDGVDHDRLCTAEGLREIAEVADGIGPAVSRLVAWPAPGQRKITDLARLAHEAKLFIHGYTIRRDELPKNCPGLDDLHAALFRDAGVDGMFTDFTDLTVTWLRASGMR